MIKITRFNPFILFLKCLWHLHRRTSCYLQKKKAISTDRRVPVSSDSVLMPLFDSFPVRDFQADNEEVISLFQTGIFDFLGTGWISRRSHLDSSSNDQLAVHSSFSGKLKSMISQEYRCLDWQTDPRSSKSGSAKLFWKDNMALSGTVPGFDIKQPWELGRMQYLPEVALYAAVHPDKKKQLELFFRDSILDFISSNPFDMGAQWACSMDVAVRAVNLLVAHDLFRTSGTVFDSEFESLFSNLIVLHGRHIWNNLEKQLSFSNNHYFADLCGLIFIGTATNETTEGKRLLRFGVKEFRKELHHQFLPDGGNFEASTTYHVQVGEMVVFTLALLAGKGEIQCWSASEQQFVSDLVSKIRRLAQAAIAPDGRIVQIGDNDSGVFLHLAPIRFKENGTWNEDRRNIAGFLAAASALLSRNANESSPDCILVQALMRGESLPSTSEKEQGMSLLQGSVSQLETYKLPFQERSVFRTQPLKKNEEIKLDFFPDFGLAIWRCSNFWMSLFWGQPGQCGVGGHSHNDKLSMILFIDKQPILNDPGSFCYTGDPQTRNLYRSWKVHPMAIPVTDPEDEFKDSSIFSFHSDFSTEITHLDLGGINIVLKARNNTFKRSITIQDDGSIHIETESLVSFNTKKEIIQVSDGYGSTENRKNIA